MHGVFTSPRFTFPFRKYLVELFLVNPGPDAGGAARYNRCMQIHKQACAALVLSVAAASPPAAAARAKPVVTAAVAPAVRPFVPRFARVEQSAEPVSFDACEKPYYPNDSVRDNETGTVNVWFKIAADGMILKKSIARGSGFRKLDNAALAGFLTCKFRPATINGKPVRGYGGSRFVFSLE
ncbi:energy transducer TonB [Massilia genomosp. 1]|uniref:TonB family protein n=1 Tax=Massilia genomosp. 1 TaxID=2609280 RepID=A0ABX0MSD8_9BURK|nr:energy transducer TonB [Massilia genomosp. 1]NHZ65663.1 TonB family protein [Massilia genomosp. 1]